MKRFLAVLLVALVAIPAFAQDRGKVLLAGAPTSVRTSAILTTSDVNSTTFVLSQDAKAVLCYVGFTVGSSSGVYVTPISQATADGTVSKAYGSRITVPAATDSYVYRIPATDFGGRYVGFAAAAHTTNTGTLCSLGYRVEY